MNDESNVIHPHNRIGIFYPESTFTLRQTLRAWLEVMMKGNQAPPSPITD
jgi:hypothetical protein